MRWMGYQLRYGKLELMELGPPVASRLDLTGTMTCRTVQQKERQAPAVAMRRCCGGRGLTRGGPSFFQWVGELPDAVIGLNAPSVAATQPLTSASIRPYLS